MKNSLLIFGTKNFNNSFNEIKEYLDFTLIFFEKASFSESSIASIKILLVDSDVCHELTVINLITKLKNKPLLLFEKKNYSKGHNLNCSGKISLPSNLIQIRQSISSLIMSTKFIENSSIDIKDYKIDKNKRILQKDNLVISITEREIQLIELLFNAKKPLTKNIILKQVWNYSNNADTHTIETHIYRLRKKILKKFNDESFIINTKTGYAISKKEI
tara:strand:- start:2132 stop:2782 length:651 start_codon:yes stop_codon:yes gene_type:complete